MASVLFIKPPQVRWENESKRLSQPLGLLSIMGFLREHGHSVHLCDAGAEGYDCEIKIKPALCRYGLSDSDIGNRINKIKPDIVCINSTFTMYWNQVRHMAELVKRMNNRAIIIIGGHHASGAFKDILKLDLEGLIDFIALGEGEIPTLRLIEILEKHGFVKAKINSAIEGVAFRKGRKIFSKYSCSVKDLDTLPDPAFDLLNYEVYTAAMSHYCKPKGRNFFTYLNQRGCNNRCEFCTTPYYWGREIRLNSIKRIRNHVNSIRSLGFEEFVLQDDNILLWDNQLRRQYLRAVSEAGFYAFNDAGYYYPLVERYHVDELSEFGIYGIFLPVENPSLDRMHGQSKYLQITSDKEKIKKLKKVSDWLNKSGIRFYSAIMVGFPGEDLSDLKKAVHYARFIKALGAFHVTFNFVHPYPGTPLYRKYYSLVPEERRWQNNPQYYNFIKPVFPFEDISLEYAEEYINEYFREINGMSDRNPSFLWQ